MNVLFSHCLLNQVWRQRAAKMEELHLMMLPCPGLLQGNNAIRKGWLTNKHTVVGCRKVFLTISQKMKAAFLSCTKPHSCQGLSLSCLLKKLFIYFIEENQSSFCWALNDWKWHLVMSAPSSISSFPWHNCCDLTSQRARDKHKLVVGMETFSVQGWSLICQDSPADPEQTYCSSKWL